MKCPVCGKGLTQVVAGQITVDACEGGCGGIWFDRFELQKVDAPEEPAGEILLEIQRNRGTNVDTTKKKSCPKCQNIIMMQHFYSVRRQVLVDECPNCGGFWLDAGELARIRNQFSSEIEKEIVTEQYISDIFDKYLGT